MTAPLAALLLAVLAGPASASKILIIGDSHTVGPFGVTLDEELSARGHEVAVYAVCSATAKWWIGPKRHKWEICHNLHDYGKKPNPQSGAYAKDPPLAEDLIKTAPDVVVFALGSNSPASTPDAAETLLGYEPKGAKCVWIGPPPMPSLLAPIGQLYNDLPVSISKTSRACRIVDSTKIPCMVKKDGATKERKPCLTGADATKDHFYGEPAKGWARAAADFIAP